MFYQVAAIKPIIKPIINWLRPIAKQSEKDVGKSLGANYRPQVSNLNGKEVAYGTKGSVRPDFISKSGSVSFEVKNYNIQNNASSLVNNVAKQAISRVEQLPKGSVQNVIIDVRGKTLSAAKFIALNLPG